MYKQILSISLVIFCFIGCGGSGKSLQEQITEGADELIIKADPGKTLETLSDELNETGGVSAVGEGQSKRRDLAKEKAQFAAEAKIAQSLDQKMTSLRKKAVENIGQGEADDEINENFSTAMKSLSQQILKGATVKKTILAQRKDGVYYAWSLVIINPKMVNSAMLNEVKKKNVKLYERMQTSKLFDELNKEEKEYEAKMKEVE